MWSLSLDVVVLCGYYLIQESCVKELVLSDKI